MVWDQAESDSYPQTMPGYYGCQTLAHVSSWRTLLEDPALLAVGESVTQHRSPLHVLKDTYDHSCC